MLLDFLSQIAEANPREKSGVGFGIPLLQCSPGADLLPGTAESSPAKQLCKNLPTLLMLVSFVPHSALERLSCISGQ